MRWIDTREDTLLPIWLKDNLNKVCPECGSALLNGYNEKGQCTRRICSNKECNRTIAAKAAGMLAILGVSGIQYATAYKLVKQYNLKNHFDILSVIDIPKQSIALSTFCKCAMIYGINEEFDSICSKYNTLDELLINYNGKYKDVIKQEETSLRNGVKYFDIKVPKDGGFEYDALVKGYVMITGEIPGVRNREDFVYSANSYYKGLVRLSYSKSARKTDLFCCIAEDKFATTRKVQVAREVGAPVYNVQEFLNAVNKQIIDRGGKDSLVKIVNEGRS